MYSSKTESNGQFLDVLQSLSAAGLVQNHLRLHTKQRSCMYCKVFQRTCDALHPLPLGQTSSCPKVLNWSSCKDVRHLYHISLSYRKDSPHCRRVSTFCFLLRPTQDLMILHS